ncbi:hypothetical protein [Pontixanthobacter sp. CEM42]|uniref:hypothetical protein n=1 Tax=Pontixanthobacter sp. CEM42 TaxID=2792077 RepID=UPI001ADF6FA1|nr:hypothetical protein [Pontixanthobacter sp. CEM42]
MFPQLQYSRPLRQLWKRLLERGLELTVLEFWNDYRSLIQFLSRIALVLAALRYGAGPERWASYTILWMAVSTRLYFWLVGGSASLQTTDTVFFLIDLSVGAMLIWIALRANRMYTLWLAGFQILAILAHLARGVADGISPIAYAVMMVGPSYFQTIILAFGIWFHHRRVKRHGNYRSWRTSSPPSRDQRPQS